MTISCFDKDEFFDVVAGLVMKGLDYLDAADAVFETWEAFAGRSPC